MEGCFAVGLTVAGARPSTFSFYIPKNVVSVRNLRNNAALKQLIKGDVARDNSGAQRMFGEEGVASAADACSKSYRSLLVKRRALSHRNAACNAAWMCNVRSCCRTWGRCRNAMNKRF